MRPIRTLLRFWITLSAGFSFVVGWALLAHAPKPIQPTSTISTRIETLPTLAPLPPLDLAGTSHSAGLQLHASAPQQQSRGFLSSPPIFQTGGS